MAQLDAAVLQEPVPRAAFHWLHLPSARIWAEQQQAGGGTTQGPGKVQLYLPSAADLHGWEKKLFSSAFHAREIINKLIIY